MVSTDATAVGGTAAEIARKGAVSLVESGFWVVRLHYPIFNGIGADGKLIVTCSCCRTGCGDSAGKHPVESGWGKGATRDVEVVQGWFRDSKGYTGGGKPWNVGIVLGLCHGIPESEAVVDVEDDTDEGRELATELFGDAGDRGMAYSSGGKSLHRLFRWSEGLPPVANLKVRGLEFRFGGKGKETQSVAPPSMHRSGRRYEWLGEEGDSIGLLQPLPESVKAFLLEEFERQRKGSNGAVSGGGSRGAVNRLHTPIGKIGEGERHHALLTFANSRWRDVCNAKGIARLEDSDVEDDVLMDVLGRNLLVCQPPKTDEEVRVICRSAREFMLGEIQRERDDRRSLSGEAVDEGVGAIADGDGRDMTKWIREIGVRLSCDPSMDSMKTDFNRIDEWVADGWSVEFATKSDDDRVKVTVKGFAEPVVMRASDFNRYDWFARRIHTGSSGAVTLNRTFAAWDWRSIWEGRENGKGRKNGITRGLREWLETHAVVAEDAEALLRDQVEDLILALAGASRESVLRAVENWEAQNQKCTERLKLDTRGEGLVQLRVPEDPLTGWYKVKPAGSVTEEGGEGEVHLLVKIDEVTKRYRSAYGSGVQNIKIAESLAEIGFEKKKLRIGAMQGRWFVKSTFDE